MLDWTSLVIVVAMEKTEIEVGRVGTLSWEKTSFSSRDGAIRRCTFMFWGVCLSRSMTINRLGHMRCL
jgi:hypothetical protein